MIFRSLKTRISVIFLGLILTIQLIGSIAIHLSIEENARKTVMNNLAIGEKIFLNLLDHNGESLTQAAKILATDYGFRQAIGSNDFETILSAVSNHQSRINADIAFFYSNQHEKLIASGSVSEPEAHALILKLIDSAANGGENRTFIILKKQPYQLVAVPVKAPITIGWIVMGFEINNKLADSLHTLSNLEVTFISQSSDSRWLSNASTLGADAAKILTQNLNAYTHKNAHYYELNINNTNYGSRYVKVHDDIFVMLQQSIDQATAPYKTLQTNLFILTLIGASAFVLGIYYVSNLITRPISSLANSAKALEKGNYVELDASRKDELGQLSKAFNNMSSTIIQREKRISLLAFNDSLTKLPNRLAFIQRVEKLLIESKNNLGSFSVLVMDINRFKQMNNILGHDQCNLVLISVANRLSKSIREDKDFIARLGGDEFAVLLANTHSNQAREVALKLIDALEVPVPINDQSVDISAGFGLANFPEHADSTEQLMNRAEIAMYVAKKQNVGCVIYDHKFDATSQANLSMASNLKEAIYKNHLLLYVQPKVDLASQKVTATEALIRWRDPEKGFIFPDEFIPFAEQTGLIRELTQWVLNESAAFSKLCKANGHPVCVAVNISARDLIDHDLPTKLASILNQNGLSIEDISLEITESSIMDDPTRANLTLDNLHKMGVKLSIDDFGTGHSSLSYLKNLPVSELKIDKSFVLNLEDNLNDKMIVQSTIALGHSLGLKVVAEGIENETVWNILAEMGCDYGQGYYMAKPIPANDFLAWVKEWNRQHHVVILKGLDKDSSKQA